MNDFNILYIFFVIVMLGSALYYFYSKAIKQTKNISQARKKEEVENMQTLLENICRNANVYITDYNNIISEVDIIKNQKRNEISSKNDLDALTEFKIYCTEFQEQQEIVVNQIENLKTLLDEKQDFNTAFVENKKLKENLENLSHVVEKIKYIEVKRCTYSGCNQNVNSNTISQKKELNFFHGCLTQMEADKRYRNLSKAFHPDTGCGDTDLFQKMTDEYNNLQF